MPNERGHRSEFRQCASLKTSMMRSVPRALNIEETHGRYFSARTSRLLNVALLYRCYGAMRRTHEGVTDD